jgi:ABC-type sugar transport system substrate-binding protein
MKRVVVVLLVLLMVLNVVTVVSAEEARKFTLVLPMGSNDIWNDCADGFKDACAKYGVEAVVLSPGTPNDANEMNALVEAAIADGTDGLVTQGVNPEGQAAAFKMLDDAKIPYCLVNSDAVNSNRLAFIGTGDTLGIVGGKAILDAMGDKPIVFATALFNLTAPIAISLHEAYLSVLKDAPGGFKEAIVIDTESDQMTSVTEWTNALMTYPEVNAGMNICGYGGLGAVQAMKELGYKPGDVKMMAIDFTAETLQGIRDGYLYGTMTQNFYRMGYEPVVWMNNFLTDGTKPEQVVNDSGTTLVTMQNIDTFMDEMRDPTKW